MSLNDVMTRGIGGLHSPSIRAATIRHAPLHAKLLTRKEKGREGGREGEVMDSSKGGTLRLYIDQLKLMLQVA